MARTNDRAAFVEAFSGSHQYVLDYLMDEVLGLQPDELQDFLVRTAMLPRMCAGCCDAVLGRSDGQEVLEGLERDNLFVVALDEERRWYRYHHLFRDLLKRRLMGLGEEERDGLYRRAAEALAEHGSLAEAVELALEGRQFDRAATWLETESLAAFARGEMTTFERWIRALPPGELRKRHCLSAQVAWGLAMDGRTAQLGPLLEELDERARSSDAQEMITLRGHVALMRAVEADKGRRPDEALRWVAQAERLIPDAPDQQVIRAMIPFTRARALRTTGQLDAARQLYQGFEHFGLQTRNIWTLSVGFVELVSLDRLEGDLASARRRLERLDTLAREYGARHFGMVAPLDAWQADLLLEANELDRARTLAETALHNLRSWRNPSGVCHVLSVLVRIELAAGRVAEAGRWVEADNRVHAVARARGLGLL